MSPNLVSSNTRLEIDYFHIRSASDDQLTAELPSSPNSNNRRVSRKRLHRMQQVAAAVISSIRNPAFLSVFLATICSLGIPSFAQASFTGPSHPENGLVSPAQHPAYPALLDKVRAHGEVPIIVGFGQIICVKAPCSAAEVIFSQLTQQNLVEGQDYHRVKRFTTIPYLAMSVNEKTLTALFNSSHVNVLREDVLLRPFLANTIWLTGAQASWTEGFTGHGQTVALLDTGIYSQHPSLEGQVVEEACFSTTAPNIHAQSLCPNGADKQMGVGAARNKHWSLTNAMHGTVTARVAAGAGTEPGIAPKANILAIQMFSRIDDVLTCPERQPSCVMAFLSDQLRALEFVYQLRDRYQIAAVNLAGGTRQFAVPCDDTVLPMRDMVQRLRDVNIPVVAPAGNDGYLGALAAPACLSQVISVGASTATDQAADFSNLHPAMALFAPGDWLTLHKADGNSISLSGTSLASAQVAGAWALLKEASPQATIDDVLKALQTTGHKVYSPQVSHALNPRRIQIDAALQAIRSGIASSADSDSQGEQITLCNMMIPQTCYYADGRQITTDRENGTQVIRYPDGREEIVPLLTKNSEQADSSKQEGTPIMQAQGSASSEDQDKGSSGEDMGTPQEKPTKGASTEILFWVEKMGLPNDALSSGLSLQEIFQFIEQAMLLGHDGIDAVWRDPQVWVEIGQLPTWGEKQDFINRDLLPDLAREMFDLNPFVPTPGASAHDILRGMELLQDLGIEQHRNNPEVWTDMADVKYGDPKSLQNFTNKWAPGAFAFSGADAVMGSSEMPSPNGHMDGASDRAGGHVSAGGPGEYMDIIHTNDGGFWGITYSVDDAGQATYLGSDHYTDPNGHGVWVGTQGGSLTGPRPEEGTHEVTSNINGLVSIDSKQVNDSGKESVQYAGRIGETYFYHVVNENGDITGNIVHTEGGDAYVYIPAGCESASCTSTGSVESDSQDNGSGTADSQNPGGTNPGENVEGDSKTSGDGGNGTTGTTADNACIPNEEGKMQCGPPPPSDPTFDCPDSPDVNCLPPTEQEQQAIEQQWQQQQGCPVDQMTHSESEGSGSGCASPEPPAAHLDPQVVMGSKILCPPESENCAGQDAPSEESVPEFDNPLGPDPIDVDGFLPIGGNPLKGQGGGFGCPACESTLQQATWSPKEILNGGTSSSNQTMTQNSTLENATSQLNTGTVTSTNTSINEPLLGGVSLNQTPGGATPLQDIAGGLSTGTQISTGLMR